jgi:hypothetical protein
MTITAAAARRILRRQGMPSREIRAVLAATIPSSCTASWSSTGNGWRSGSRGSRGCW